MEVLLDSRATELVMSSEFARKQGFKLKKFYYQRHRERIEIDMIKGQKWNVILEML